MIMIPENERKTDADGCKQTGATRMICGVRFCTWRVGIGRYESRSDDQRIRLQSNFRRTGYNITVDGAALPKTFRYERTAVTAALAVLSGRKTK